MNRAAVAKIVKPTAASIAYPGSEWRSVREYRLCCIRMKVDIQQRSAVSNSASKSRGLYGSDGVTFDFFADSRWV